MEQINSQLEYFFDLTSNNYLSSKSKVNFPQNKNKLENSIKERETVISYIFDCARNLHLQGKTRELGIIYFDKCLKESQIPVEYLHFLAIVCLSIATKLEGDQVQEMVNLRALMDKQFVQDITFNEKQCRNSGIQSNIFGSLYEIELYVMKILEWKLIYPTTPELLILLLQGLGNRTAGTNANGNWSQVGNQLVTEYENIKEKTEEIIEFCIIENSFTEFNTIEILTSCVEMSLKLLNIRIGYKEMEFWNERIRECSKNKIKELKSQLALRLSVRMSSQIAIEKVESRYPSTIYERENENINCNYSEIEKEKKRANVKNSKRANVENSIFKSSLSINSGDIEIEINPFGPECGESVLEEGNLAEEDCNLEDVDKLIPNNLTLPQRSFISHMEHGLHINTNNTNHKINNFKSKRRQYTHANININLSPMNLECNINSSKYSNNYSTNPSSGSEKSNGMVRDIKYLITPDSKTLAPMIKLCCNINSREESVDSMQSECSQRRKRKKSEEWEGNRGELLKVRKVDHNLSIQIPNKNNWRGVGRTNTDILEVHSAKLAKSKHVLFFGGDRSRKRGKQLERRGRGRGRLGCAHICNYRTLESERDIKMRDKAKRVREYMDMDMGMVDMQEECKHKAYLSHSEVFPMGALAPHLDNLPSGDENLDLSYIKYNTNN